MRCKYYDCGFCYAPNKNATSSILDACGGETDCTAYNIQIRLGDVTEERFKESALSSSPKPDSLNSLNSLNSNNGNDNNGNGFFVICYMEYQNICVYETHDYTHAILFAQAYSKYKNDMHCRYSVKVEVDIGNAIRIDLGREVTSEILLDYCEYLSS